MRGRDRLAKAHDLLARWRAEHGGLPESMWAEVVEVARVEATARAASGPRAAGGADDGGQDACRGGRRGSSSLMAGDSGCRRGRVGRRAGRSFAITST
jgi:hypothetical protein